MITQSSKEKNGAHIQEQPHNIVYLFNDVLLFNYSIFRVRNGCVRYGINIVIV